MKKPVKTDNGFIYAPDAMFLHVRIGTGTDAKTGNEYELQTTMHSAPVIVSKKTGQVWHCPWDVLIELAVKDGIDSPKNFIGARS